MTDGLAYACRMIRTFLRLLMPVAAAGLLAACQSTNLREPTASLLQDVDPLAQNYTQQGLGYMQAGYNDLAWQRFRRALDIEPDYSAAHNGIALLYEKLKQPSQADEHFLRAVTLDPGDSSAQTNYGSFLCRQGRVEEAEQRFLQALKNSLYPNPEIAYTNAGVCLYRSGEVARAERYLRSALEIDPRMPPALYAMAEIKLATESPLSARAYFQRYLEVGDQTPAALWLGIRIERQLGDVQAVNNYGMRLRTRFPDSEETVLLLESGQQ